jgi:hypothetical protein
MSDHEQVARGRHTEDDEYLLADGVIRVAARLRERVSEYRGGFLERDCMLGQVLFGLLENYLPRLAAEFIAGNFHYQLQRG